MDFTQILTLKNSPFFGPPCSKEMRDKTRVHDGLHVVFRPTGASLLSGATAASASLINGAATVESR